jgi:alcohol dehydrogenase class IV
MSQHVIPKNTNDDDGEIVRPAFSEVPNGPHLSYNLPFDKACAKHVEGTFNAERVYILASGSLCRNTKYVEQLRKALGSRVAGLREGMTPHTLWNEVLEVADDCRRLGADLIVTIGGGSLTDAAKIVTLVSEQMRARPIYKCRELTTRTKTSGSGKQRGLSRHTRQAHDR